MRPRTERSVVLVGLPGRVIAPEQESPRRLRRWRRPLAASALLVLAGVVLGFLASRSEPPEVRRAPSNHVPVERGLPSGRFLLYDDEAPYVVGDDIGGMRQLETDLDALEISPDGTEVLATRFQREPTGITRNTELLVVQIETGRAMTLVDAGPKDDLGPAAWSPDGAQVAYRLTTYERDPARVHPHGHGQRSALCLVPVAPDGVARCLSGLGKIDGFAWSPTGELVVDGVGPKPLWIVDARTGRTRALGRPNAEWWRRAGISGEPWGFFAPSWSASGRYLAAVADARQRRLLVFDRRGRLVASGHPFNDIFADPVWSPSGDVIASASITGAIGAHRLGLDTSVRLLDPEAGRDRLVRLIEGYPLVYGLEWSPTGRELVALLYRDGRYWLSAVDVARQRWSAVLPSHQATRLIDSSA